MSTPLSDPDSAGAGAPQGTHPTTSGVRGSATPPPVAPAGHPRVPPVPEVTRTSADAPVWPSPAGRPAPGVPVPVPSDAAPPANVSAPAPNGYPPAPNGYAPAPNAYASAPHGYAPAPTGYAPGWRNAHGTAPQGYAPGSSAPAGFGATPTAYAAPPAAGSNAYRAPWQSPDGAAYGAALDAVSPARSGRLGVTALVLSIIALVVAPVLGAIGFAGLAPALMTQLWGGGDLFSDLTWLAPVAGSELLAELAFYLGTVTGVVGVTAGIIAVVQRRGRRAGIVAIVLGLIAPLVFVGAAFLAVTLG